MKWQGLDVFAGQLDLNHLLLSMKAATHTNVSAWLSVFDMSARVQVRVERERAMRWTTTATALVCVR